MKPFESILRLSHNVRIFAGLLVLSVTFGGYGQDSDLEEEEDDSPFASGLLTEQGTISRELFVLDSESTKRVKWRGVLESQQDGPYRLAARFRGRLKISLNGELLVEAESSDIDHAVSDSIELEYDYHDLQVTLQPIDGRMALTTFWSGPDFLLEPIPAAALLHKRAEQPLLVNLPVNQRGIELLRSLRCEACHDIENSPAEAIRSPALEHVVANTKASWLHDWLVKPDPATAGQARSAKEHAQLESTNGYSLASLHQQFSEREAADLIAWMQTSRATSPAIDGSPNEPGDTTKGSELFHTVGCLACHAVEELGNRGAFAGGDLTHIGVKRNADFFARWLTDPGKLNPNHRMPKFDLSSRQVEHLAAFLTDGTDASDAIERRAAISVNGDAVVGKQLAGQHRCNACHKSRAAGDASASRERTTLGPQTDWSNSCFTLHTGTAVENTDQTRRPDYSFVTAADAKMVQAAVGLLLQADARQAHVSLLAENNCTSCHMRGEQPGLSNSIPSLIARFPRFANDAAALKPPSLNSVGDKLHVRTLRGTVTRKEKTRRHWLKVQMPKFPLADDEVSALVDRLVASDRVPDALAAVTRPKTPNLDADSTSVGARLLTADGFGCTSCHAIGKVRPPSSTPFSQLGPTLSNPQERIRKTWFDRWVRNPARITPRMEMPSVQIPVPGVLNSNLDLQLASLWQALGQPRFSPPDPAPTRVVGHPERVQPNATRDGGHTFVLTDVIQLNGRKLIKPFLIGLPNRQNVLLDLNSSRVAAIWFGDTARQRTQGKTWFWEPPTIQIAESPNLPDIALLRDGKLIQPKRHGQFMTEPDDWRRIPDGVLLEHRLHFDLADSAGGIVLQVTQRIHASGDQIRREVYVRGLNESDELAVRVDLQALVSPSASGRHHRTMPEETGTYATSAANKQGEANLGLVYPPSASRFTASARTRKSHVTGPKELPDIVPGFVAQQLATPSEVMPIAMTWMPSGELVVGSLKGRVWMSSDSNDDQLIVNLKPIGDDMAAPYGLHAEANHIDVLNKYGLLRLHLDAGNTGRRAVTRHELVASGWGHTDDYHDWVVGLPKDNAGNYYISIPCQQDDRSPAAARFRGNVLRLSPRQLTKEDPRRYGLEPVSAGHRFPMGIAMNRAEQLFVTDNQGNFNPYNELNHVRQDAHFGFINKLDRREGYAPKLTPPAIDIPHPWTRSVNGICFLESPQDTPNQFGPFEGHLVGCEYDTRRLVRMTMEEIDGWMQGAVYPFAEAPSDPAVGLQGPINCAISPGGALYVANIRDSGWGGANNTGSIVRITPDVVNLPAGIRDITALGDGFRIRFTKPVDKTLAAAPDSYNVASVRRISTPVYGGDDVDRRTETVLAANVDRDGLSVDVKLGELREGFVYEFKLKNLAPVAGTVSRADGGKSAKFYPAEGYYTLRRIPR